MNKHWQTVALGEVLNRTENFEKREEFTEYHFAGTYSFARGIFASIIKSGSEFKLDKIQRVNAGNFVYCKIMAWEGAFGLVPYELDNYVMSGAFVAYEIDTSRLEPKFLSYFFKKPSTWQSIGSQSSGTNVRRQSLHPHQFEKAKIKPPEFLVKDIILDKLKMQGWSELDILEVFNIVMPTVVNETISPLSNETSEIVPWVTFVAAAPIMPDALAPAIVISSPEEAVNTSCPPVSALATTPPRVC